MTTVEPMIAVRDVAASSRWYQELLGCRSEHGGEEFNRLVDEDNVVLLLHHWGAPEHPSMLTIDSGPIGHGLLLYFRVENIAEIYERAVEISADHISPPAFNSQSHQTEFSLQDPDGYFITICSSPGNG